MCASNWRAIGGCSLVPLLVRRSLVVQPAWNVGETFDVAHVSDAVLPVYSMETSSCFLGVSTPLPGFTICFSTPMAIGGGQAEAADGTGGRGMVLVRSGLLLARCGAGLTRALGSASVNCERREERSGLDWSRGRSGPGGRGPAFKRGGERVL